MVQTVTPPEMRGFNPFRERLLIDPYPRYREVRDVAPVYWSDELDLFFLLGYEPVRRAITDFDSFSNRTPHLRVKDGVDPGPQLSAEMNWFMNSDPPDHTPLRRFFGTAFTPRRVRAMQASVAIKSRELLEAALHQGNEFDFVRELAYPLPTMVISSFIGAPTEDIELFKDWSTALSSAQEIGRPAETVTRVNEAVAEAREYLHRLLELRKVAPQEDLLSYALGARDETLTDERLVDNCILMLSAGHETTINFLGNALLALLSDDAAMQRLRRDPLIMPVAVEELLRFDTPVQVTSRVATRNSELSGVEIHEGERVVVLLGAGNRDPLQFDNPDRLDFDRQPNQHVAFGHGAHHCLGAPIARLESIVVFETMLDMFESIELAGEPETGGKVMTRGWKQIPIRVSTRNGS